MFILDCVYACVHFPGEKFYIEFLMLLQVQVLSWDWDVFSFSGMSTSPTHLAFTGCHGSIHQDCLCPEGCFHAFLWLLETPLKARSISALTVTEPSCSPILSLEIYRDRKRLVGNPSASTFGFQSVSFRRQNATEDHLDMWLLHFLGLVSYTCFSHPGSGSHAIKPRLENEGASLEGTAILLFLIFFFFFLLLS